MTQKQREDVDTMRPCPDCTPTAPTCAEWCGTDQGPPGKSWHAPADRSDYCTKECASDGQPRNPVPR